MISGLTLAGLAVDQTWPYYTTVALVGVHLAQQIVSLNIDNPNDCARKFISNHQVGLLLFVGVVLGTLLKEANAKPTTMSTATLNQTAVAIQQRLVATDEVLIQR